jgi:hypothetical protein
MQPDQVCDGDVNAYRTVVIQLQNEDRTQIVVDLEAP